MNITLVVIGILLLGYSFYVQIGFFSFIKNTRFLKWWGMLSLLQALFAVGYIVFAYWLVVGTRIIGADFLETLISLVFFFGAVFAVTAISLIYHTIRSLFKEREEVEKLHVEKIAFFKNKEQILEGEISKRTAELEKAKTGLEKAVLERTAEMEQTKADLEKIVASRTEKLNEQLAEAEEMNRLMVGRELRMIELKNEIAALTKNTPGDNDIYGK